MSAASGRSIETQLGLLAREILTWNKRFNLVTRVETDRRLDMMIRHCRDGWMLVRGAFGDQPWFPSCSYVDIGSGAGLPGLVWSLMRAQEGHAGACILVEPRERRAWFLRRTARALALPDVAVATMRWGDEPWVVPGRLTSPLILSLKALSLDDGSLLDGALAAACAGGPGTALPSDIYIVRFMAPVAGERGSEGVRRDRESNYADSRHFESALGHSPRLKESRILGSGVPRLDLRHYIIARSV